MDNYAMLKKELEEYVPFNEQESLDKLQILESLKSCNDLFTRENKTAHFTVSAWIVNKKKEKVLMAYHNIYNSWAWLGGHADGEMDLRKVIEKEIQEESGLVDYRFISKEIFSLEILTVDGHEKHGKYVSSHLHYNVTFLLEADDEAKLRIKEDENSAIDWISTCDIKTKSTEKWFVDRIYSKLCDKVKEY